MTFIGELEYQHFLGYDANVLDAPALKKTRLDTNWKHP